jgi:hypothetical protein
MPARIGRITFDCPQPQELAAFYAELLVMPTRLIDRDDCVVIGREGNGPRLAFAAVLNYRSPTWPDPQFPQQLHLDIPVHDAEAIHEESGLEVGCGTAAAPGRGLSCLRRPRWSSVLPVH